MSELSVKINIVNTNVYNSENTLPIRNNFGVAFFVMIVMAHLLLPLQLSSALLTQWINRLLL
jgi:hypothetical protein